MRTCGLLVALLTLALAAVPAWAHEYKLADGTVIPTSSDIPGPGITTVRRFRMVKGEALFLLVTDSPCRATISAQDESGNAVRIQGKKASGRPVQTHSFKLKARNVGTFSFNVRVRGEALTGGDENCDEDSTNTIIIDVVESPEDLGERVSSFQPFFSTYADLYGDIRVELKGEFKETREDIRTGVVPGEDGIWGAYMTTLGGINDAYRGLCSSLSDYRSTVNSELSSGGLQSGEDPRNTSAGGCGDYDALLAKTFALSSKQYAKLLKDFKKLLRGIEVDSDKAGTPWRINTTNSMYGKPSMWAPSADGRTDDSPNPLRIGLSGGVSHRDAFGMQHGWAWTGGIADPARGSVAVQVEGSDGTTRSTSAGILSNGTWCVALEGFSTGVQLRFRVSYQDGSCEDSDYASTPYIFARISSQF
jgi:hypothetical protein